MDQKEVFKNFYLFNGLNSNDLNALEAITERRAYTAGEVIFSEGDVADALFIIEAGTVEFVPKGKEVVIATLGSGQGFGESAFFAQCTRPATAAARERGYILRIPFDKFSKMLAERPDFALVVYRNACTYFAKHFLSIGLDLNRRYL
jgi:CRP-like cAMP-binding protein